MKRSDLYRIAKIRVPLFLSMFLRRLLTLYQSPARTLILRTDTNSDKPLSVHLALPSLPPTLRISSMKTNSTSSAQAPNVFGILQKEKKTDSVSVKIYMGQLSSPWQESPLTQHCNFRPLSVEAEAPTEPPNPLVGLSGINFTCDLPIPFLCISLTQSMPRYPNQWSWKGSKHSSNPYYRENNITIFQECNR